MPIFIIAAVLAILISVSLISLIITTEAASRRGSAMKRAAPAFVILGAFILCTSCSTTHGGIGAKRHSVQRYSAKKPVGYVKRATFTTEIKNREPTNNISELPNNQQKIYYFTDIRGMQGQKVRHHWLYKGKLRAEVEFNVKGPRWRVYSSKWLERGWLGDWTVVTVDRQGRTLSRDRFSYKQAKGFFGKSDSLRDDLELFGED